MFRCFLFVLLAIIAYFDIKTLEINIPCFYLCFGIVLTQTPPDELFQNIGAAIFVWIIYASSVLLFVILGKDAPMGMGDIKLLSVLSLNLGGMETAKLFAVAGLLSGLTAAVLLALKKASSSTEIPFAPFIAAAYGICGIISGL